MPVVGGSQHPELAAGRVRTVVRLCGQQHDDAKLVARRLAKLPREDLDHLWRPQKLALEIDRLASRAQRARVRLHNPKVTLRQEVIDLVRDGPHDLKLDVASGGWRRRLLDLLGGHLAPTGGEVRHYIAHRRATDQGGGIVPSQTAAHRMITGVETVAAERRQIDAPDERDLAIHDHQLLVMTMHRPLMRIKRALHSGAADQLLAHAPHRRTSRRESPHRRSRPQQQSNLDALRQLTEQITQPSRPIIAPQTEIRRNVPPGDMHMRASAGQRLSDPWQRLPAIHQHLKRSPRPWRGIGRSPQRRTARRFQLIDPANTLQPATMMPADRDLDPLARPPINALNQATGHRQSLTRRTPGAETRSQPCTI